MDRISHLPDFILHQILSFLYGPSADLVRMSVLSKKWFHLTASFPYLDFILYKFRPGERASFFKYVEYTTNRFSQQDDVTTHMLTLVTSIREPAELDVINRCLELLLHKGVSVLIVDVANLLDVPGVNYRLPNVLLSVTELKYLSIRGCDLPSSLTVHAVKFKSLIELRLEYVYIDDEAIKHLTISCPLLRAFSIRKCHGFKRFCVYRNQNLQRVWMEFNTPVEIIDIEAPNLSLLILADCYNRGAPRMNLASCKKLTSVSYLGHPLPNSNGFNEFLYYFPYIEYFILFTEYKCNNLKLSSHSLRALALQSNCDLEKIEFSTPNLVLFVYSCNPLLTRPLEGKPWPPVWDLSRMKVCMHCHPDSCIDALWFKKLRLFLDKKNGFKVLNLYIRAICSQELTELDKVKAIELPPYELEHVELQLDTHEESSAHVAFVDVVLWCCRPRSLTLRSSFLSTDFEEQSDVVKFTYKKLLEQDDHTSIQIVGPSSSEAQKRLRDMKSLSMALPRDGKAISFIKEEVVQEEALSQRFADMEIF